MTRARLRGERGQSAVELALFLPVLLTILYVVIQFGEVYLQYQEVSAATSEGARTASRLASTAEPTRTNTIVDAVKSGTSVSNNGEFNGGNLTVAVTSGWVPGGTVTVTAGYDANVTILGITLFSGKLTTKRTARVIS
jgi:Flp pilus assembly protein TadG